MQREADAIIEKFREQRQTLPLMRTRAWEPRPRPEFTTDMQVRLSWRALKHARNSGSEDLYAAALAVFNRDLLAWLENK